MIFGKKQLRIRRQNEQKDKKNIARLVKEAEKKRKLKLERQKVLEIKSQMNNLVNLLEQLDTNSEMDDLVDSFKKKKLSFGKTKKNSDSNSLFSINLDDVNVNIYIKEMKSKTKFGGAKSSRR